MLTDDKLSKMFPFAFSALGIRGGSPEFGVLKTANWGAFAGITRCGMAIASAEPAWTTLHVGD